MNKITKLHWLVLLTCSIMLGCTVGIGINSYGVLLTAASAALGVSKAAISMHSTICGLVEAFTCPILMKAVTKKKLFKPVVCAGILLNAGAFFLMAFAGEIWQFNVLGVMRGIGAAAFYFATATTVLGNWFRKNIGTFSGILSSAAGLSAALMSPVLNHIVENYGYKAGYVTCGAVVLLTTLPLTMLISLTPEEKGLKPYAEPESIANTDQPGRNPSELKKRKKTLPAIPLRFASATYLMVVFMGLGGTISNGLTAHITGYTTSVGLPSAVGATMISMIMIGNTVSKPIYGIFADYFPTQYVHAGTGVVCVLGLLMLLLSHGNVILLMTGAILFGTVYALTGTGMIVIMREIYGNEQYTTAYATCQIASSMGSAVSITIVGFLYDLTGSYAASILMVAALVAAGCLAILLSYRLRDQQISTGSCT